MTIKRTGIGFGIAIAAAGFLAALTAPSTASAESWWKDLREARAERIESWKDGYALRPVAFNRDRREDIRDRRGDIRDRREDIRDRREDRRDARVDGGWRDRMEDIRDRREDIRDRREDRWDRREDRIDRRF